ncbi:MAG: VWA domain-containing protein [Gammaproteobacteria bacterium]|nr:VWA domain-containing protein [Gammaproteobacteria bacterium]
MPGLPEQLHFLRPEAFYAFIPLMLFVVLYLTSKATSRSWKAVCDDRLLPYILIAGGTKAGILPMLLIITAASLSIVALAGPVWKKLPQPVFTEESALVIALDLSQSMHATDIKPSRLERAKLKALDLIKARKGGQTALIVYAATAFTVTPLTDDDNTIANLVPALEPGLMPAQGSNAAAALELSTELLEQAGINRGDVLLVTDGIADTAKDTINALTANGHRLSVMGVGTTEGSPIPLSGGFLTNDAGAIVIPRLDPAQLQRAALKGGGLFVTMQADDSDIEKLAGLFTSKRVKTDAQDTDITADIWQEEGPWLVLLVLPLVALWPRRGWLICLVLFTLPPPQLAYALDPVDLDYLWLRQDQKAMREFNQGNANQAAELFNNTDWKAAAHYRAGNYDMANELLTSPGSSTDYYNKGNVLARLGSFEEAIKAYDEALTIDPSNEDARFNRELVEQALQQQQSQEQQQQQQDASQNQQQDQQSKEQTQSNQTGDQQQAKEHQRDQLTDLNEKQDQQESEKQDQEQADVPQPEQQQDSTEQALEAQQQHEAIEQEDAETVESEQAMEQWLRRIPDDPGGLMRRKFIYQYRQIPNQAEAKEPW